MIHLGTVGVSKDASQTSRIRFPSTNRAHLDPRAGAQIRSTQPMWVSYSFTWLTRKQQSVGPYP